MINSPKSADYKKNTLTLVSQNLEDRMLEIQSSLVSNANTAILTEIKLDTMLGEDLSETRILIQTLESLGKEKASLFLELRRLIAEHTTANSGKVKIEEKLQELEDQRNEVRDEIGELSYDIITTIENFGEVWADDYNEKLQEETEILLEMETLKEQLRSL